MKIVVIGGTGLIWAKTVDRLRREGHEVDRGVTRPPASDRRRRGPRRGAGGRQVVVDLANSPSFEDKAVLEFFETSGRNLMAAEAAAGVKHHVALSVVGTERCSGLAATSGQKARRRI